VKISHDRVIPFIKTNDTKALIFVYFSIIIVLLWYITHWGATLVVLLPDTKRLKSLPQVMPFLKNNNTTKALIIVCFSVLKKSIISTF